MLLKDQIRNDIKEAMKAKKTERRDALRLLSSAMKQIEVDERKDLSDDDVIKIIQKQVKQRNDAASQYKDAGRDDLYDKEIAEIKIYEPYLPAQMDDAELEAAIQSIIEKSGATSMKEMGKVMGAASAELSGKADGKRISSCVKQLLG
ncbi:MAG: GatB/YqeY domain-containing protein [Epsilonproteobacteria bacterium]|nr:MAG: GatB/YqeY domain-containing protein [Campylobacterota bacterium]